VREFYIKDIIDILSNYKGVLYSINTKQLDKPIKELEKIIIMLTPFTDMNINEIASTPDKGINKITQKTSAKMSFREAAELWSNGKYNEMKGIKLDYSALNNRGKVVSFIKENSKEEILKITNVLDLNLLYFILTGEYKEIKKRKEELYNLITSYIKANKQGEAFSKLV
jgi:hypothetical protein